MRQLRQDLAKKKATFYVDVHARMGPATTDVRTWANTTLKKINGVVPVSANTAKASSQMADWRRRQAGYKATIPVHADMSQANRDVETWRKYAGRDLEIRVKTNVTGDVERVRRAATKDATMRVRADKDSLRDDIRDVVNQPGLFTIEPGINKKKAKAQLTEFFDEVSGTQLEMDLGIDTTPAETEVKATKAKIEKDPIKAALDLDLKRAKAEYLKMRTQVMARKLEVGLEIKKKSADSIYDQIQNIEKRFGNFTVLRSLDLGPLTLGKPTGLIGTITSITALAGLVPGAVTGIAALSDAIMRLAGAASIAPGAIGALAASIATISFGTQGVGEAFGSMFEMWNEGASEGISSANSLVSAQNNYRNAVVDEGRAQKDVANARREALGELRDLNNELRGGVLNEAQALLDLQKAKDRYAQGGFDNETDRLQALLDIQKAELNVDTTRESNIKTQQRANEANVQGVEGSDRVTQALENQTRASQATAQALAAVTEAQGGASSATSKYNEMLNNLSPNARDFVETFAGLKGEIKGFQQAVQDTIFEGAGPGFLKMFDSLMPVIEPGVTEIAKGLNQNLLTVFDTLGAPGGQSIIERILGGTAETQKAISKVINPLVTGIGTLVAAGAEHLPQIIDLVGELLTRFSNFITKADKDGSLDKFMDEGVDALGNVAEIGINVLKILDDMSDAFGGDLLKSLADATGKLHEYLSSAEGQADINAMIQKAKEIWDDWRPVLEDLPGLFEAVSDAAKALLDIIMPFLNTFTSAMEEAPGLVQGFIFAWLGAKVLTGVFSPILTVVKGIKTAIEGSVALAKSLPGLLSKIPPIPGATPTTPGVTPPVVAGGAGAGSALATAAGVLAPIGIAGAAAVTTAVVTPQDNSISQDESNRRIEELNKKVPAGLPKAGTDEQLQIVKGMQNTPVGHWLIDVPSGHGGTYEAARRWTWFVSQPNADQLMNDPNFQPPQSYEAGGYTDWGRKTGRMAELHGGEFIQPAPSVGHYGVGAMEAIRQRKAVISYEGGGPEGYVFDPVSGQFVAPGTSVSHGVNPAVQSSPGLLGTLATGVSSGLSAVGNVASQVAPTGGTAPDAAVSPFGATGALPGPAGATGTPGSTGGFGDSFLSALGIPGMGGGQDTNTGPGWGEGGPPVGLGGGPDGFDIRKFGIGPGPAGSGPNDWMKFAGKEIGGFATSFIQTLGGGLLDSLGISGLSKNITQFSPLLNHFFGDDADSKAQAAGADETNAAVSDLLGTEAGMPGNPAYPGYGALPGVFDPSTGSAIGALPGLQPNTARGEMAIKSRFPWATNIGGVRSDSKKWHPSGLALDVMIPGGTTRNGANPQGKAYGDQLYAWLEQNAAALGSDYRLWQTDEGGDHYDHIHVNFAPSGPQSPGATGTLTPAPNMADAKPGSWGFTSGAKSGTGAGGKTWTIGADGQKEWKSSYGNPTAPPPGESGRPYGRGPSAPAPKQAPGAMPPTNKKVAPPGTPLGDLFLGTFDRGGWIMPGTTIVNNNTGKPEWAGPVPSFAGGGFNFSAGAVPIKPVPPPMPRPPDVQKMQPPKTPTAAPKPAVPAITPTAPPVATPPAVHGAQGGAPPGPGNPPPPQGPSGAQIMLGSNRPATGVGAGGGGDDHVNPALRTGITSGFATAGKVAGAAASMGMGGMGGGMMGGFIEGLFGQAGKIANNVANVASSFLVGNITGGTTENPYGVTQRGSVPSGGTRVVDASNNQYGDVYTNNLDEYFKRQDRRNAQRAQSGLGQWGNK